MESYNFPFEDAEFHFDIEETVFFVNKQQKNIQDDRQNEWKLHWNMTRRIHHDSHSQFSIVIKLNRIKSRK